MQMDKAETSLLLDVAAAGELLVAVGERGHILYSDNEGQSWTQARVPTSAMLTRVFFVSPELGWAVGHDGNVLVSRDGGVGWDLQRDGVRAQAKINNVGADRAKKRVNALREQLGLAAPQEKATWLTKLEEAQYQLDEVRSALNNPVFPPPLMDVWFSNKEQGWASGAYGTLLYTANGGRQWQDWSHKINDPEQLHLNGVTVGRDGTVFLASEWGNIFRSSTSGETWEAIDSGYEGSFFGIVESPATGSLFAYGLRGSIYRSTNKGENWSELESQVSASLFGAYAADNGDVLFVGSDGVVTRSLDDGETFSALLQDLRLGAYGVARMPNGRYILSGEGGSRLLSDGNLPIDRSARAVMENKE